MATYANFMRGSAFKFMKLRTQMTLLRRKYTNIFITQVWHRYIANNKNYSHCQIELNIWKLIVQHTIWLKEQVSLLESVLEHKRSKREKYANAPWKCEKRLDLNGSCIMGYIKLWCAYKIRGNEIFPLTMAHIKIHTIGRAKSRFRTSVKIFQQPRLVFVPVK